MHYLHLFFKNLIGETPTPPPSPYSQRITNSPLLIYMILYSWGENSPASRISKIGALKEKNYTQFLGEKSTRTRQKMGSEHTIGIHFFKNFPGGGPRTPTCGRRFPPPAPSPCGASRRFGYAPGSGPSGSATGSGFNEIVQNSKLTWISILGEKVKNTHLKTFSAFR